MPRAEDAMFKSAEAGDRVVHILEAGVLDYGRQPVSDRGIGWMTPIDVQCGLFKGVSTSTVMFEVN